MTVGQQCPNPVTMLRNKKHLHIACTGLHLDVMLRLQAWMVKLVFHFVLKVFENCRVNFHCRQMILVRMNELNVYIIKLHGRANPCHVMECYNVHQQQSRGCSHNSSSEHSCTIVIPSSHWYSVASSPHKAYTHDTLCMSLKHVHFHMLLNFKGKGKTCPTQSKGINLQILQLYGMNAEWILASERQLTSICTLLSHGRNCKTWVSLCNKWLLLVIYNTRVAPSDHKNIPYTIKSLQATFISSQTI